MIRQWSIYREADGILTGDQFSSSIDGHHMLNIPAGCAAIEGKHDHLSRRIEITPNVWGDGVDGLSERRVVDWQPPAPSTDHEWSEKTRRWEPSAAAAEKDRKRLVARARIRDLEVAQARRVRELLAQDDERLKAIDQEISALRIDLAVDSDQAGRTAAESQAGIEK
jgi:hypothetical protein